MCILLALRTGGDGVRGCAREDGEQWRKRGDDRPESERWFLFSGKDEHGLSGEA